MSHAVHSYGVQTPTTTTTTSVLHDEPRALRQDRVRWGPVFAGLFAALSTLAVLAVLGIAIGFSAVDPGDSARAFGLGAGIWTIVSVLIAFFVGGMVSARTAATPASHVDSHGKLHDDNGLLQGAMVWMVAIPLSIYFVAGGITSAIGAAGRTAGSVAQTTATAAAPAAGAAAQEGADRAQQQGVTAEDAQRQATDAANSAKQQASDALNQAKQAVTPERVDKAADYAAGGAWGTLASMLIGLGAASVGGLVGGKSRRSMARSAV